MNKNELLKFLKKYRKSSKKSKKNRFYIFEKKMLYRTTKTENPSTTMKMVQQVIRKAN